MIKSRATKTPNPKIIKRENAVEVKIPRERVILGDIPDNKEKTIGFDKYRR